MYSITGLIRRAPDSRSGLADFPKDLLLRVYRFPDLEALQLLTRRICLG
jgi:hypothetical protein